MSNTQFQTGKTSDQPDYASMTEEELAERIAEEYGEDWDLDVLQKHTPLTEAYWKAMTSGSD